MKLGIEVLFLYLGYILQIQQSRTEGFWTKGAWTVPEKYTCNHAQVFGAAGSACAQQEKVTCWVSRPWEKQIFLYYMLTMTTLSILLKNSRKIFINFFLFVKIHSFLRQFPICHRRFIHVIPCHLKRSSKTS